MFLGIVNACVPILSNGLSESILQKKTKSPESIIPTSIKTFRLEDEFEYEVEILLKVFFTYSKKKTPHKASVFSRSNNDKT